MNHTIYVFGSLEKGFTQYPDDYTEGIFLKMREYAQSKSQIIIHRDGNLMYYGYIRFLEGKSRYIGLCIILNDAMFTDIKNLFSTFENAVADMIARGAILQFDENGRIISKTGYLREKQLEVERIIAAIRNDILTGKSNSKKLPPVQYDIAKSSDMRFEVEQNNGEIVDASYKFGYTCVFKDKNYNTAGINSYQSVLRRINTENESLKKQFQEQKSLNDKLEHKQRNTVLIAVLSIVIAILGIILYFTVINPSEVTHFETGEFVYYGPMKNKQPHGVGVAIYPENDKDGRKYYIGNFENGMRQDDNAILFYKDGDYYYGAMKGDEWEHGLFFSNSDKSHFVGDFKNNSPYNGVWYSHEKAYEQRNGVQGRM